MMLKIISVYLFNKKHKMRFAWFFIFQMLKAFQRGRYFPALHSRVLKPGLFNTLL